MMLMMGINLVAAQDTNSANAAGFFNCCIPAAGLETLREEVRKIARARGLNYEPSRTVRVRRSRSTGISVNGAVKGLGVFNKEQRRTLELELELPSQQELGMFCLVDGHRFGPGNALPVGAPCKIGTPGGDRLGYITNIPGYNIPEFGFTGRRGCGNCALDALHKPIGSPLNQLEPRVGGTFQPAQPAQLPVPPVFVPPIEQVQQMQHQVGYFCAIPGIGRFGPGPMNAIGVPCLVGPYRGSITF
jgi:hypothetical protein